VTLFGSNFLTYTPVGGSPTVKRRPAYSEIIRVLVSICKRRLTQKQKFVLRMLLREQDNTSYSKFSARLSESTGIPLSTVKRILKSLRECGLVEYERGVPLRLSSVGELIAEALDSEGEKDEI